MSGRFGKPFLNTLNGFKLGEECRMQKGSSKSVGVKSYTRTTLKIEINETLNYLPRTLGDKSRNILATRTALKFSGP